ncbi:MAG: universal stress protein UspA [Humidesulfovibrio sp.]|uniref:universal stress protein UspA n=1 Tax=Humidesulfovibrio sp. TaxID=2910988 RepID=UPI0027355B8A|nr:universal stress protein UspA [Humidesulfovibrio sp.]MDP2846635.1 universal stress protein UspA [Humidesulfovibrio sp.]
MNKHLLVTISEDASAQRALRFVCGFFKNKDDIRLTLFNTAPQPPAVWGEEKSFETLTISEANAEAIIASSKRAMVQARQVFVNGGFSPAQVDDKIVARNFSRIDDIIKEGESGLYDAVVFGRRALLKLENFLDKSASEEMLEAKFAFPLWLCRNVDYNRHGVLLCVDDSEAFRRMADHVGFILHGETEHPVTLLRVIKKSEDTLSPEALFSSAVSTLEDNGFPSRLIRTRLEVSDDVPGTILREAEAGRYAAVAVGRTGMQKGPLARIFATSVTIALFNRLNGAALWVSR